MEDWPKDFVKMLEQTAVEFEHFFDYVNKTVEIVTEDITQVFEEIGDRLQNNIMPEIEQSLVELFEPFVELYTGLEDIEFEDFNQDTEFSINPKVEPSATRHPACIGCRNYHGRLYGDNLLVCGIHPYGWDDANCPDWQANI